MNNLPPPNKKLWLLSKGIKKRVALLPNAPLKVLQLVYVGDELPKIKHETMNTNEVDKPFVFQTITKDENS